MSGSYRQPLALAALGCTLQLTPPAFAQQTKMLGLEETIYVYCEWMSSGKKMVTQIEEIRWRDDIDNHVGSYVNRLAWDLERRLGVSSADCEWTRSPEYPFYAPGETYKSIGGQMISVVQQRVDPSWFIVEDLRENIKVTSLNSKRESPAPLKSGQTKTANAEPGKGTPAASPTAAEIAAKAREQREAEFQAKLAAHQAKVAEYKRKVAAREAEIARQQQELAADAADAAREKAAYEAKMDAHRRELAEANRRQQEYFAAQRRHALCLNGDREACADIEAGKSAMGEALADAGEASTDTDATQCMSSPVVGPSSTFQGQTAATVVNGCETAVDVRICLMREGGWNCGVNWGLKPQERWAWTSFKATGEVFWDARVAGSAQPLASPEGT